MQHRTESRRKQVTPIMRPCTVLAHVSRTRVLREIPLCTIPPPASIAYRFLGKEISANPTIPLFSFPMVILKAAERNTVCSRASTKASMKPGEH